MKRLSSPFLAFALSALAACGDDTSPPGIDSTSDVTPADTGPGDTALPDTTADTTGDVGPTDVSPDTAGDVGPGDTVEPPLEACPEPLPAVSGADLCDISGSGDSLLIRGNIVLPEGILEGGSVLVVDGFIACSGCDCGSAPEAAAATVITCPDGVVSPGLINAHDHITFSQMEPQPHGTTRWDHRNEWRTGANGKPTINRTQNPDALGDAWGELRQVFAGTTSLFGSGGEAGFLRNLDRENLLEGIVHDAAEYATFPVHGGSSGLIVDDGCNSYDLPSTNVLNAAAYVPHVSEGVIAGARNEFVCLSGVETGSVDVIEGNTSFIHGIGVTAGDIALFTGEGATLVWSPRTNVDLYGFTAEAQIYHRLGGRVALGTDWTASGSVNMLRELACAEEWNERWGDHFSERELVAMATSWAAASLGFDDVLGALTPGKVADIVIWDARANPGYRAILDAGVEEVALVLRGGQPPTFSGQTYYRRGRPLYGDPNLVEVLAERQLSLSIYDPAIWGPGKKELPPACEPLDVCGRQKLVCAAQELEQRPRDAQYFTTQSLSEFIAGVGSRSYDLFFCGVPDKEPTCVPSRPGEFDGLPSASDADGDGIPDGADNCPSVFNGIRPMDNGRQPDADGDGVGDSCDPCPLDADTTACSTSYNPDDIDNDGFLNPSDNCPSVANEGQEDADEDGIGDVCDACPNEPNIGGAPCSASIPDIKQGVVSPGTASAVKDVVVTAVGPDFFTVQPLGNTNEFGGLYVFTGTSGDKPAVGDKLDVQGRVGEYFGQIQLSNASFVKTGTATVPAPLVIDPADAAPGGAKVAAYEALLVEVRNVTVTNTNPQGQPNETVAGEFLITGGLTVDDHVHALSPAPVVGEGFSVLRGVLRYSWERNKLLPRSAMDAERGAPIPVAFSPTSGVVRLGESGVAVFDVVMSRAVAADTTLQLAASPAGIVGLLGAVIVPAGADRAAVEVDATGLGTATITATYGGETVSADVTVVAADTPSVLVELVAEATTLSPGATTSVTVELDLPAPTGGTEVTLEVLTGTPDLPGSVTVLAGQRTASFDLTAPDAAGSFSIRASAGPASLELSFTVATEPLLGAAFCFDGSTATVSALDAFTAATVTVGGSGASSSFVAGNTANAAPAVCPAAATNEALSASGWASAATSAAAATDRHFALAFSGPGGSTTLTFDLRRSNTGPAKVAVWTSSGGIVASDLDVPTSFGPSPMFTVGPFTLPAGASEVRIFGYSSGGSGGTLRIDNAVLTVQP